jgi:PilZ domain
MKLVTASESGTSAATANTTSVRALGHRRHIRYPLEAELNYQWSTRGSVSGNGVGRSRNISEGGTFVIANVLPPLGASIALTIHLPAWQAGAAALRMEMTGEVVRVDVPPGREQIWGFAICSLRTLLRRLADGELCAAGKQ